MPADNDLAAHIYALRLRRQQKASGVKSVLEVQVPAWEAAAVALDLDIGMIMNAYSRRDLKIKVNFTVETNLTRLQPTDYSRLRGSHYRDKSSFSAQNRIQLQ